MIAMPGRSLRILVTAGPTREAIDRVRFISNASTGKMGYEIARLAQRRRHRVILISGPANILPPKGVEFVSANTALQMRDRVKQYFKRCDCLIMTAAVSDFRPKRVIKRKIKKTDFRRTSVLELTENPDILLEMGKKKEKRILVGFALETENLIENARAKLKKKKLDLIVANQLTQRNSPYPQGTPFGDRRVRAVLISGEGAVDRLTLLTKEQLAKEVLKRVEIMARWPNS